MRADVLFACLSALCLLACSARDTCEHYRHKSFDPMPDKAIAACAKTCLKDDFLEGCEAARRWYFDLGDTERAREMGRKACELRGEDSCDVDRVADAQAATAAYNADQVAPLRARLRACAADPAPCEAGCARGELNACVQLADNFALGLGRTADPERAHELYARACELHDDARYCWSSMAFFVNAESCVVEDNRPDCDEELDSCPPPPQRLEGCAEVSPVDGLGAEEHLRICNGQRACDQALEHACLLEIEACQRACDEHDDAARCRQVARMHERGLGLPRNPAKAAKYLARACELGDTDSCPNQTRDTRKLKPRPLPSEPASEAPAAGSSG